MSEVEAFFRFCPSCGRRFHVRIVSRKMVDMKQEEQTTKRVIASPRPMQWSGGRSAYGTFAPVLVEEDVPIVVNVEDFQYQYKCKHCGHEWSENKIVQTKGYPSGASP